MSEFEQADPGDESPEVAVQEVAVDEEVTEGDGRSSDNPTQDPGPPRPEDDPNFVVGQ